MNMTLHEVSEQCIYMYVGGTQCMIVVGVGIYSTMYNVCGR